jgi:hypothetical protein
MDVYGMQVGLSMGQEGNYDNKKPSFHFWHGTHDSDLFILEPVLHYSRMD